MSNLDPLVSVIIPTYKRGKLIKETIKSVIAQTYQNYELIIVDDASPDDTAVWIAENYPQLQLIPLENNLGGAGARNVGLKVAKGELIAFLDHDDRWLPDYLTTQVKNLQSHPNAVMSYCDYFEVKEDGKKVLNKLKPRQYYPDFTHHLLMHNVIHSFSLTLIKKQALLEVGFLKESLVICNDLELYLRLSCYGKIIHLPQALVLKYSHEDNLCNDYWLWHKEALTIYDIFFAHEISQPYRHLEGKVKCHTMVLLGKIVWRYKRDYLFALITQCQALIFAPLYRLELLSTRWRKMFSH